MSQEGVAPVGPVRIELATSELEGGRYEAWADPGRVLSIVAVSSPGDTFQKAVEPRLRELELAGEEGGDDPGKPPALVSGLVDKLREAHARLWRENHSLMRDPRSVELTCALAEEDRVYFIKGAPTWTCLLRGGRAHPAGQPPDPAAAHAAALGRSEKLSLEVTSMAVRPGDTVVIFASESDLPPDLHAVENLFARTPDLKRACDGLVNLLGLQAEGAGAVAMRFVPVAAGRPRSQPNPLDDLIGEWGPEALESSGLYAAPGSVSAVAPGAPVVPASPPTPAVPANPQSRAVPAGVPSPVAPEGVTAPAEEFPGLDSLFAESDPRDAAAPVQARSTSPDRVSAPAPAPALPVSSASVPGPAAEEPELVGAMVHAGAEELPRPRARRATWFAVLGLMVLMMAALVALPRSSGPGGRASGWIEQAWKGGSGGATATGVLMVSPQPMVRAVLVDGEQVAAAAPARVDSIPAGRRRVTLDLGPCGTWEGEFTVRTGEPLKIAPHLVGSLSVTASDASMGGRAWVQGRPKVTVPAVFDSLPIGWTRIFYEDERIPMWDRIVLVKPGKAARVMIPNESRGGQGAVRVEALRPAGREGLVDSEGDTIRVDGRIVGTTPLDLPVGPGLHSVRVGPDGPGAYTEVLEVKAGSARSVLARLDGDESPVLRHVAPGRVLVRGPIVLTVEVTGTPEGWGAPRLHLPDLSAGLREIPMSPVEGNDGKYFGSVGPESIALGHELRYYFTLGGPDGTTAWSELYQLLPEAQWAGMSGGVRRSETPTSPAEGTPAESDSPSEPPADDPAAPAIGSPQPPAEELTPQ